MKHISHKFDGPVLPGRFGTNNKLMTELQEIATYDTAKYFFNLDVQPEFIPSDEPETFATLDASKAVCREEAWKRANVDGFVAEYGVDKGKSFIQLCKLNKDNETFGFDAFLGLPNGVWPGNMIHQGMFNYDGQIPFDIPSNGTIINGWFNKTLPKFNYRQSVAKFLHIDCDVYSSTVDILTNLVDKIVPGTVIVFDDYCNHPNWRQGEWLAWLNFVQKNNIKYKYLYVAGMSVALQVI
jgi:hypothetical protein